MNHPRQKSFFFSPVIGSLLLTAAVMAAEKFLNVSGANIGSKTPGEFLSHPSVLMLSTSFLSGADSRIKPDSSDGMKVFVRGTCTLLKITYSSSNADSGASRVTNPQGFFLRSSLIILFVKRPSRAAIPGRDALQKWIYIGRVNCGYMHSKH